MNLQGDEPPGVSLVHLLIHEVFDEVAIHPRLNPGPPCDNAQLVPPFIDEVPVSLVDLLLG